ncbi:branched-chain amino acid transport system substrate-binding protein [Paucimonas lemoignei]|uniref:Branched-chain amino acid transport system substrate-binding protein n=1 Tax=Paucimonas lemoignei TaxID=29443 RepID=A0A4V2UJ85_PAULE|nr:ABC transporter substrate-binding protein [Paucimonas lemoignei]TCS39060.1 branched-chain amino acid transport system substrate-binding protein [Paucimonas lemoignei]
MAMNFKRKFLTALVMSTLLGAGAAHASKDNVIRIGVLTDFSGTYADIAGKGALTAVEMAVEDFSKDRTVNGKKIEVIYADHLNKADIAASKAREWYDTQGVDIIVDLATSSAALAVTAIAEQKNKIALVTTGGALPLTNDKCTPVTLHWVYDTYSLTAGTAKTVVDSGKKSWYFITADYVLGHSLEQEAAKVVKANDGEVKGAARHPFPGSDFSSYLMTAQSSKADVIALANAGSDLANTIKQANEFGITTSKQTVLPLLMFISDVHAMGLKTTQGLTLTEAFYWNRDEKTRAWARRFYQRAGKMPTSAQAGDYSGVTNYLKAVKATGTTDTATVMKYLKSTPIDDGLFKGQIRADGRLAHDMLLVQVKSPAESKEPWDYYKIKSVIPADVATMPLSQSQCKLVKK